MTQAKGQRRRHGEDSIYWDSSKHRYVGAVSLGFAPAGTRIRRKVTGRTKAEVRGKLRELHREVDSGLRPKHAYTVNDAFDDWLAHGLDGVSARTVTLYQGTIVPLLKEQLGAAKLRGLTAGDVQHALTAIAAQMSTRTVQICRNVLVRAIRQAERDGQAARNVAALAKSPKGQRAGRPSKSLTLDQAIALMEAAKGTRLEAYITVSLLAGLRTEEARALRWSHVVAWVGDRWQPVTEAGFDHPQLAVFVWRSERAGGDTKTPKSRRTLALAHRCAAALREQKTRQAADRLAAGQLWHDHNLVFASTVGTPLDDQQHPQAIPQDHPGRRARRHLGAPRATAHVRLAAVRARRASRSDRAARRPQPDGHHRAGLPASHRPCPHPGAEIMDEIFH